VISRREAGKRLQELGSDAPKALAFIASLAGSEWLDGRLCVDIVAEAGKTHVLVMDDVAGVRELAVPRVVVAAPFADFERGLAGKTLQPLEVDSKRTSSRRIALVDRGTSRTARPPAFDLAEDCFRRTRPPPAKNAPLLEIPRTPKVLDFGDFATPKKKG
jgi:hypothetical protein